MKKAIATVLCLVLLASAALCYAEAETDTDILGTMAGMGWTFSSGAGGWSTDLQIREDGTFTGEYHDSDMGDTGDGYPDGTVYFCNFSGKLSLAEQVDENTWKIRVDELTAEPAEEEIADGMRFVPADSYGITEGDVMTLYAPGTPAGVLSEELQFWAHLLEQETQSDALENWFLASEANETGFVGYLPVMTEEIPQP